jgi:hypothetical protein
MKFEIENTLEKKCRSSTRFEFVAKRKLPILAWGCIVLIHALFLYREVLFQMS